MDPDDPLTKGDGLGPVFNARSCLECHNQGGPGGGGPVSKNVMVYALVGDRHGMPLSGVVHLQAVKPDFQETLDLLRPGLPHAPTIPLADLVDRANPDATDIVITQRNTPPLFGDGLIDVVPDDVLIAHMRQHMTAARLVGLNHAKDSEHQRPDRPARRRPARQVRLEAGIRHPPGVRQSRLCQ